MIDFIKILWRSLVKTITTEIPEYAQPFIFICAFIIGLLVPYAGIIITLYVMKISKFDFKLDWDIYLQFVLFSILDFIVSTAYFIIPGITLTFGTVPGFPFCLLVILVLGISAITAIVTNLTISFISAVRKNYKICKKEQKDSKK